MSDELPLVEVRRDQGPATGYSHPAYAQSLAEFGTLVHLPRADAWLLARNIANREERDAIGAYPFFACDNYGALREDLDSLSTSLVSASVVPDMFGQPSVGQLEAIFDPVTAFKTHYLADLKIPFADYMHRHHRRYAKVGFANFKVEAIDDPRDYGEEWSRLYGFLVEKHGVTGIRAFSRRSLSLQLEVPGCVYFRAMRNGTCESALVCYLDRGIAYAHLIGATPEAQKLMAQYALYWTAIEYFRSSARWFALGSTPGSQSSAAPGGLDFFKAGWATATCQSYFCGRILDRSRYEQLSRGAASNYFPAYRTSFE